MENLRRALLFQIHLNRDDLQDAVGTSRIWMRHQHRAEHTGFLVKDLYPRSSPPQDLWEANSRVVSKVHPDLDSLVILPW
jgi:hypothetical protein